jgi:CheY-like chemotaxis protein
MLQQLEGLAVAKPALPPLTRVMSVDDNIVDQIMVERIIDRVSRTDDLVTFNTPAAALNYLATPSNPPIDLILLDVNMPRMNGFDFLDAAHRLTPQPVIPAVLVMLTSILSPSQIKQAEKFDVIAGYLNKPLSQLDLETALSEIATAT